jgi:hypothetical protein
MPAAAREGLQIEERAARWAMLPQDARIIGLGGMLAAEPDDTATRLRRERLMAAQNLSEARALLLARQLEMTAGR